MKPIDLLTAADHKADRPIPADPWERRAIRERAGVSRETVAVAIGCSARALQMWESTADLPRKADHQIRYGRILAAMADYSTYRDDLSAQAAGRVAVMV